MKVRACLCLAMVLAVCFAASVAHATLQDDVDQAVSIIERFEEIPESAIPPRVLRDAKGLAILTVTKAGFIVSGRGGVGVVVALPIRAGAVLRQSALAASEWVSKRRAGLRVGLFSILKRR
jgi:lipid-binding SYLF domain-containing protein